jgi:hypothetical protein
VKQKFTDTYMDSIGCRSESHTARQNKINILTMEQNKKPVEQYYYSESEWNRLGCGPLPVERDRYQQMVDIIARNNPKIDGNHIKGYN